MTLICEGRKAELDVPARYVTTDSAAASSAAQDGPGIIVLAEFEASHHLTRGALVQVLPDRQCPSLPLHLVTPTTRKRAARVQAFMGIVDLENGKPTVQLQKVLDLMDLLGLEVVVRTKAARSL